MKTSLIMAFTAALLASGNLFAGEIVKRPLGKTADGRVIEGYVYEADRRNRPDSRYGHGLHYSRGYRPYFHPYAPCPPRYYGGGRNIVIYSGPPVVLHGHGPVVHRRVIAPYASRRVRVR